MCFVVIFPINNNKKFARSGLIWPESCKKPSSSASSLDGNRGLQGKWCFLKRIAVPRLLGDAPGATAVLLLQARNAPWVHGHQVCDFLPSFIISSTPSHTLQAST